MKEKIRKGSLTVEAVFDFACDHGAYLSELFCA